MIVLLGEIPTIRSRLVEVRFPLLPKPAVSEILTRLGYAKDDARLGSALGGGSVTRAVAALEGEEESLRAQVVRWFFESVRGRSPEQGWASRETLDEGLETVKTLVRDWVAATAAKGIAPLSIDQQGELGTLPALEGQRAVDLLAKIDDAQRLARTNVSPAMVSEIVRMALTRSALTRTP